MSLLALVAMALLALVPTVNRLSSPAGAHPGGLWEQLCTATGMKLVQVPTGDVVAPDSDPAGAQHGFDCAYCPLLLSLATLVLALVLAELNLAAARVPIPPNEAPARTRHPSGLGSRGPPAFLQTIHA